MFQTKTEIGGVVPLSLIQEFLTIQVMNAWENEGYPFYLDKTCIFRNWESCPSVNSNCCNSMQI